MKETKFNVGDEVIVEFNRRGIPDARLSIDRVARKYFYVNEGAWNELAFEIATGRERVENHNYPQHNSARAYTPQEYEDELRHRNLRKRLDDYDVQFGWRSPFRNSLSDAALEQILDILDAELSGI